MVERLISDAVTAMSGELLSGDAATRWRGAVLDSRQIRGGELFFALPGEHADGHEFTAKAAELGAAGIVVHRDEAQSSGLPGDSCWIRVSDTFAALHDLTRQIRRQVPQHLVGITGSAGKTTTKELLAAMLSQRFVTDKSPGNLNNLYGFPLALLGIDDNCEWMVAEMGMSTPGELAGVSRLGRPEVAVFTNVRAVHLENFADLAAIADAKAELLAGLADDGLVVANADDPHVMAIAQRFEQERGGRVLTYGIQSPADVRATVPVTLASLGEPRIGSRFELKVAGESQVIDLPIHGLYNVENCLAAAACAHALGVSLEQIQGAVANLKPGHMRGEVHQLANGVTVIDDCYNSNPDAAIKALESAAEMPASSRLAVLGDMLELGPQEAEFHQQVGRRAAELAVGVLAVGQRSRHMADAVAAAGGQQEWFADAQQAAQWLSSAPQVFGLPLADAQRLILVKGSRGVGLEVVVDALLQAGGEA